MSSIVYNLVGLIVGFLLGVAYEKWHHHRDAKDVVKSLRGGAGSLLVVIFVVLAVGTIAQIEYGLHHQRQAVDKQVAQARCQERYNEAFLVTINERAVLSDADRDNLAALINTITLPGTKPDDIAKAFDRYQQNKVQIDHQRDKFQFPKLPPDCDGKEIPTQ